MWLVVKGNFETNLVCFSSWVILLGSVRSFLFLHIWKWDDRLWTQNLPLNRVNLGLAIKTTKTKLGLGECLRDPFRAFEDADLWAGGCGPERQHLEVWDVWGSEGGKTLTEKWEGTKKKYVQKILVAKSHWYLEGLAISLRSRWSFRVALWICHRI